MPMIKAIETRYAGCRFRSRLEARWAVFFDHLGIKWEYEPEGYETPAGRYLPDFLVRLNRRSFYLEVKPEVAAPTQFYGTTDYVDPRWPYISELAGGLYVTYGLPRLELSEFSVDGFPSSFESGLIRIWPNGEGESKQFFAKCPYCGDINLTDMGKLSDYEPHPLDEDKSEWETYGIAWDRAILKYTCCDAEWQYPTPMYNGNAPSILAAYTAARSARFEHGEQG